MTDAVKKLFAEYEKAFNALEVEKQVPFFAEHFISARGAVSRWEERSLPGWRVKPQSSTGASARHRPKSS